MATGTPLLTTDVDRYLTAALTDPLLQVYAPGGVSSVRPGDGALQPLVRFWRQDRGKPDRFVQDGRQSRAISQPVYIVTVLDRQRTGSEDRVYGSVGSKLATPQPHLELTQRRIYELLHGRSEDSAGFRWTLECFSDFSLVDPTPQGWNDVLAGWWVRMTVT